MLHKDGRNYILEDVGCNNNTRYGFKDFGGAFGKFPSFTVYLDDEEASALEQDGFKITWGKINERISEDPDKDGETYRYPNQMKINVSMNSQWPPKVYMIKTSEDENGNEIILSHKELDAHTLSSLDNVYISKIGFCRFAGSHNDRHKDPNGKTAYANDVRVHVRVNRAYERYGF